MNAHRVPRIGLARARGEHLQASNDPRCATLQPTLSLAKQAIRLYRAEGIPREVWKANAAKWLAARTQLGARHLLEGGAASWGMPGEPVAMHQIYAPRRMAGGVL